MIKRFRHLYLLGSLVLLLGLSPFARADLVFVGFFDVLVLSTMLFGVAGVATNRLQLVPAIVLGVAMSFGLFYNRYDLSIELSPIYPLLGVLFYAYLAIMLARHVFSDSREVTTDTLCGALSIYLLLGILWAFVYAGLESVSPGSFNFPDDPARSELTPIQRFIGFSFITLTTLGYGNIAPATHLADTLTSAQAIIGQVFLTVLVARLVALHITGQQAARSRRD